MDGFWGTEIVKGSLGALCLTFDRMPRGDLSKYSAAIHSWTHWRVQAFLHTFTPKTKIFWHFFFLFSFPLFLLISHRCLPLVVKPIDQFVDVKTNLFIGNWLPDHDNYTVKASKSVDLKVLCCSERFIGEFWGRKMVKCMIRSCDSGGFDCSSKLRWIAWEQKMHYWETQKSKRGAKKNPRLCYAIRLVEKK